jgi:hypothetical protein
MSATIAVAGTAMPDRRLGFDAQGATRRPSGNRACQDWTLASRDGSPGRRHGAHLRFVFKEVTAENATRVTEYDSIFALIKLRAIKELTVCLINCRGLGFEGIAILKL